MLSPLKTVKSLDDFYEVSTTSPPKLSQRKITEIRDLNLLVQMEQLYDDYLEKNVQLLMLYDIPHILDELTDVRNLISMRIHQLKRYEEHKNSKTKKLEAYRTSYEFYDEDDNDTEYKK